jgi:L-threonylcarbamoyladenylate synthase|tara:strand:+ start:3325 stop:3927 length:603 start_codon:yes stop_codon:yes gene_type:complete
LDKVVEGVLKGNCVVYPTSTLPALGCILTSKSLDNLYNIKKRPNNMIVSIGVSNLQQASELVHLTNDLEDFLSAFPEGSVTIILPAKKPLDKRLGGEKIAIRILANPVAKEFIEKTGPLTATSANISGFEPLKDCEMAAKTLSSLENEILFLSGTCSGGTPSTLIAWYTVCKSPNGNEIEVLREGLVKEKEVLEWWKKRI